MTIRKHHEAYYIDKDIEYLERKRAHLTRDSMNKEELEGKLDYFENVYLRQEYKKPLTEGSIYQYTLAAKQFVKWLDDGVSVDRSTTIKYREYLIANYSPTTSDLKSTGTSVFLSFVHLYDARIQKIKSKKIKTIKDPIEPGEFKRMIKVCKELAKTDVKNRDIWDEILVTIKCLGLVGIRINERQFFTVENLRKGPDIEVNFFKGSSKEIPVRDRVRKELLDYAKKKGIEQGCVFTLKADQVSYRLKKLARKARLKPKFNPHNFRHFFSLQFVRQGGNIQVLRQILGHSLFETTSIYLQDTNRNIRNQINTMELMDDDIVSLDTDKGKILDAYQAKIKQHRGSLTKSAAIDMLLEAIENFE